MIRRMAPLAFVIFLALNTAWGGEIIFVDPVHEKAKGVSPPVDARSRTQQALERTIDGARERAGRGSTETIYIDGMPPGGMPEPPAAERASAAREQLSDDPIPPPTVILKSGPPPTDAAKSRQSARSWISPAPATNTSDRCKSENTVGGVEGSPQGHTVIQTVKGGVTVCK